MDYYNLTGLLLLVVAIILLLVLLLRKADTDKLEQELAALNDEVAQLRRSVAEDVFRQAESLNRNNVQAITGLNQANMEALNSIGLLLKEKQEDALRSQGEGMAAAEKNLVRAQEQLKESVIEQIGLLRISQSNQMELFGANVTSKLGELEQRVQSVEKSNEARLESIRGAVEQKLEELRKDNNDKLDLMRGTVDEKLQSTLEQRIASSFRTVNEELKRVYEGIGEMKKLATGVDSLKKILGNVKTRGILGEVQLGAILEEILAPEQYEKDVATVIGSKNRVEFAIHMPGQAGDFVYLPIDSKFPGVIYEKLQEAKENGTKDEIEAAYKALEARIREEAKDIQSKYISPPDTTEFGIMFLPFEGLYAEVVSRGMLQELQRKYRVTITGPSTMAAYLNSLRMGFRTLAIQKRSSEVWNILGAVKTEFAKFQDGLQTMKGHLDSTSKDLDKLMSTRTNVINRKLNDVEGMEEDKARQVLGLKDKPEAES